MAVIAVSAGQWVIIGFAAAIAAAGFALMAVNVVAIIRPRIRRAAGEKESRPLIGKPKQISRRAFFRRLMLAGFGAAMTDFGIASVAFLWPNVSGGFGGKITLAATVDDIKAQIRSTKLPFYFAPGRFYLVEYPEDVPGAKIYKDAGNVAAGLMPLYQRCVHLGCRVPFCITSQWFE